MAIITYFISHEEVGVGHVFPPPPSPPFDRHECMAWYTENEHLATVSHTSPIGVVACIVRIEAHIPNMALHTEPHGIAIAVISESATEA
jgi:hypothetical protein